MRLRGQLILAQVEQENDLASKTFSVSKTLIVAVHLGNESFIVRRHGHSSEKLFEVDWQIKPTRAWIHRDENASIRIEAHKFAQDFDLLLVLLLPC